MPRKAKRPPVPDVPTGQPYGMAQDQRAALAEMPLPTGGGAPPPGPPMDPSMGPPMDPMADPAMAGAPMDPMAMALQEAQMMAPPGDGMLSGPTASPDVPWQNGLPVGPGAGPEALQRTNARRSPNQQRVNDTQRQNSEANDGDPAFVHLLRAAERGGAR